MIYSYIIFYSLYLSLFCYISCFVYAILFSKFRTIDTLTWVLFTIAFGSRAVYIMATLPFRSQSLQVISIFPLPIALAFAIADVGVSLFFLAAMFRKYKSAKAHENVV